MRFHTRPALWLTVAALGSAPNSPAPQVAHRSLNALRAELLAADSALSFASWSSPHALADAASGDLVLLYPGLRIVRGAAAARRTLDSLETHATPTRMRWHAVRADVSADAHAGYTLGYGERAAAGDSTAPMRYIAYWRRDDHGTWHTAAFVVARGTAGQASVPPAGCETPTADDAPPAAPRGSRARDAVLAADRAFAARAANESPTAAFAAYIAPDGVMLGGPTGMSCGAAVMRETFAGTVAGDLVWTPRIGDAASSGDLGFTVGVARARSGGETHGSKYLTIWRRQPDGAWRFVADGGNAAPLERGRAK